MGTLEIYGLIGDVCSIVTFIGVIIIKSMLEDIEKDITEIKDKINS